MSKISFYDGGTSQGKAGFGQSVPVPKTATASTVLTVRASDCLRPEPVCLQRKPRLAVSPAVRCKCWALRDRWWVVLWGCFALRQDSTKRYANTLCFALFFGRGHQPGQYGVELSTALLVDPGFRVRCLLQCSGARTSKTHSFSERNTPEQCTSRK